MGIPRSEYYVTTLAEATTAAIFGVIPMVFYYRSGFETALIGALSMLIMAVVISND